MSALNGGLMRPPTRYYTVRGNARSEQVIEELKKRFPEHSEVACGVLDDPTELQSQFDKGLTLSDVVVLFDDETLKDRCFTYSRGATTSAPSWASGAAWKVRVWPKCQETQVRNCANQVQADLYTHFSERVSNGMLPWVPSQTTQSPAKSARRCSSRNHWAP